MLDVATFLGAPQYIASKIVSVINSVGWIAVAASLIATILSAGGLSVTMATLDFVVITVKNFWLFAILSG